MFFIPQSVTFTFFKTPIPAILHLFKLGHGLEKLKKTQYHLKHSSLKFFFFKEHCIVSRGGI